MYEAFKTFYKPTQEALQTDKGLMFPLMKWFGFAQSNLQQVARINRKAFWIPSEMVFADLYYNIDKSRNYIKYIKKPKIKENEVLLGCLKKMFGCSKSELMKNWGMIEPQLNDEERKVMADCYGLDAKECKALGVKYDKPVFKKVERKPLGLGQWN